MSPARALCALAVAFAVAERRRRERCAGRTAEARAAAKPTSAWPYERRSFVYALDLGGRSGDLAPPLEWNMSLNDGGGVEYYSQRGASRVALKLREAHFREYGLLSCDVVRRLCDGARLELRTTGGLDIFSHRGSDGVEFALYRWPDMIYVNLENDKVDWTSSFGFYRDGIGKKVMVAFDRFRDTSRWPLLEDGGRWAKGRAPRAPQNERGHAVV
jgi:hypothetical protein